MDKGRKPGQKVVTTVVNENFTFRDNMAAVWASSFLLRRWCRNLVFLRPAGLTGRRSSSLPEPLWTYVQGSTETSASGPRSCPQSRLLEVPMLGRITYLLVAPASRSTNWAVSQDTWGPPFLSNESEVSVSILPLQEFRIPW